MALIGKIVTLFADKEKTLPRFPRTKVSAVSDENGVGLDALLESMNTDINNVADSIDFSPYAKKSELGTQVEYTLEGSTLTIITK